MAADAAGESTPNGTTLGVVVVNWRTPSTTVRAVRALVNDGVSPDDVVVVDDASRDGSVAVITSALPDVRVIELDEGRGYGVACNCGAAVFVDRTVLLFVNSDAFVHRTGSVAAIRQALQRPGVGVAVPRLLNEDLSLQPSVTALRTPGAAFLQASGLSRFLPNGLQPRFGTHWDHADERAIGSATGAVIGIDGLTWMALGGFDPVADMYAEDHDLCWRAKKHRVLVWFAANAEFVHVGGYSTSSAYTTRVRGRKVGIAEAALVRRHLPRLSASWTLWVLWVGYEFRWLVFRMFGRPEAASEARGYAEGFRAKEA